jgi:signal transduction histidine kinase
VFIHRAIPFAPGAVMNLIADITSERRLETELERYASIAAHDLREPLMAIGLFVEQLVAGLERGRDEGNERLVELLRVQARPRRRLRGLGHRARGVPKDRRGPRRSHRRRAGARRRHHHSLQLARRRLMDAAAAAGHG